MDRSHAFAGLLALCGLSTLAACQSTAPRLSASTSGSAVVTTATGGPPELTAVTVRYNVPNARGVAVSVVPDFHFVAPKGNVIVLRRELVSTTGSISKLHFNPTESVDIAADVQRQGAVISGGWQCGVGQYQVTIRAYLIDADGLRSNTRDYTIHCNGG